MLTEFRLTVRRFANAPGFTAIALPTLALCIGANLTIFAILDSVIIRPLPFSAADQLVTVYNSYPKAGVDRGGASVTNYYERRGNIPAFSSISAYRSDNANVGERNSTGREELLRVTPEFFATLGVTPAIGRPFKEEEMTSKTDDVVLLTDSYWRQHFNADPGTLGRKLRVNGVLKLVVGVLPPGFRFLSTRAQIFLPLASDLQERGIVGRYHGGTEMIGRLRSGETVAKAQTQIDAHDAAHAAEYPFAKEVAAAGFRSFVAPLQADYVRQVRPLLLLLQSGALLLLVIGGVNVVNLFLIRTSGRAKEFAVRQSLGAGTFHLVREVLTETITLSFTGGILGLVAGAWGLQILTLFGTDRLPFRTDVAVDGRLAFVALLGAVLFGGAIAIPIIWFNLGSRLGNALKSESRGGTSGRGARRLRNGFVIAQIALAFVLLAASGMLAASLKRAMAVAPGFRPDHVLTAEISLPWESYKDNAARLEFSDRLLEKLQHQPGMLALGVINSLPLQGMNNTNNVFILGRTPKDGEPPSVNNTFGVNGDYFSAMGIPLIAGRLLDGNDSHRKERVCVVDENFARHYWPQGNALGQRFYLGLPNQNPSEAFAIVGVVGSVKQTGLTESHALDAIYFPYRFLTDNIGVVARTRMSPDLMAESLRSATREIDPELPLYDLRSMDDRVSNSLAAQRLPLILCGVFAIVSLLLAGIGTYGVLTYAVAQRRREIGVRLALGAQQSEIYRQFLSIGLRQLILGITIGTIGISLLTRVLEKILFEASLFPLTTVLAAASVMALVSLTACVIPARRASKVSPLEVLGSD